MLERKIAKRDAFELLAVEFRGRLSEIVTRGVQSQAKKNELTALFYERITGTNIRKFVKRNKIKGIDGLIDWGFLLYVSIRDLNEFIKVARLINPEKKLL